MPRVVRLVGMACLTALCAAAMWLASRSPIQLLFPLDAAEIHMAANGWWEGTHSSQTPGRSDEWCSTIVHQMEAEGWMESGERYVGGPSHSPATYTRILSFGLVVYWERIELDNDARVTRIRMRRWIAIQPLKLPSALTSYLFSDR
jgi:hypothetical protein